MDRARMGVIILTHATGDVKGSSSRITALERLPVKRRPRSTLPRP